MLNKSFVRFGGGTADTHILPLALLFLVVAGLLILFAPRKYVLVPFFLGSFLIPVSQTLVLAGVHLMAYRLLVTAAWLRIAFRGPGIRSLRLNVIDKVFILWGISAVLTFSLLWFDFGAVTNRIGFLFDAIGVYFLVRVLHRTDEDVRRTIKVLAVAAIIIGVGMLTERLARINPFSILGGFFGADTRSGTIRSMGPFAHPIIAGTWAAGLLPLFVWLWWQRQARLVAAAGSLGAGLMTLTSGSSTAVAACVAGVTALLFWPFRKYLRGLRWTIVITLAALQIVMKAPVWALIAHVDFTGGSSSYHRFELVNQAIIHFGEWWLVGEKTTYQWGFNLWDTANTYVETAVTGGLATLTLFIAVIACCFKRLGMARKVAGLAVRRKLLWALGAALFGNAVGFIGITFYDQSVVAWYTLIALISVASTIPAEPSSTVDCIGPGSDQSESQFVIFEKLPCNVTV